MDWEGDPDNIALTDGEGNFALFEASISGYYGHYFYSSARGRKAIQLSKTFLKEMFEVYNAKAIKGLTPLYNRKALWMNRQLGFKSYGRISTVGDEMELFILTQKEWLNNE